jgi:anti-sigma B factor antagonist
MTVIDTAPPGTAGTPGPTTVHLSGQIDIFTSAALRRRLMNTLRGSTSPLILDLSEVTFCDSSGLAVLIGIQHRARAHGIIVILTAPHPHLTRMLHSTGLDRGLPTVA